MALSDEIYNYMEKLDRPISREELLAHFEKKASPKVLGEAMTEMRRKGMKRQTVKLARGAKGIQIYYLSPSWAEERQDRKIPKSTAKGICLLPGSTQDVYTDVCFGHCPSFVSCATYFKAFFENNGIKWDYSMQDAKTARLKKMFQRSHSI